MSTCTSFFQQEHSFPNHQQRFSSSESSGSQGELIDTYDLASVRRVQNVNFFNFSDSFFADQLNLENENRFDPLANGSETKVSQTGSDKNKFITGLKFVSININSIRGKKLELLAFLDFHQPQIVAIQETKIDSSISTSELFPESCPYNVYRKDRTLDGGGVMLLIYKDISHMPITELENNSESIWVKLLQTKLRTLYQVGIAHLVGI